ncbi:hypothetical protein LIER_00154 [Lithospermum erythrorhizon]|uniref:Integrase zinc-binding domain-containing protein n=1 Tax=Lithospermum erythrorhizon TaxID=34254 RepID=A0AAV3NGI4_LITER
MDPPSTYEEEPFEWNKECTKVSLELKEYLGSPKLLTRPEEGEDLQLYLAVSEGAVSSVLVREAEETQKPIYYVRHVFHGPEESYRLIEKFVLAVVMTARKLKAYFEANPIKGSVKAQALAEFVVECTTRSSETIQGPRETKAQELPQCKIYVDGANNEKGLGAGILIKGPKGEVFEYAPVLEEVEDWRSPIARYLVQGELPADKLEARRVVNRSFKFWVLQDELYKQSHLGPLLFCVSESKIDQTLYEVHEDHICGHHIGGQALALKITRAGYYWPTIMKDTMEYVKRCDLYQRMRSVP